SVTVQLELQFLLAATRWRQSVSQSNTERTADKRGESGPEDGVWGAMRTPGTDRETPRHRSSDLGSNPEL
ncbi:hypothetical protein INR49_011675, partial [Caranx melampygus]